MRFVTLSLSNGFSIYRFNDRQSCTKRFPQLRNNYRPICYLIFNASNYIHAAKWNFLRLCTALFVSISKFKADIFESIISPVKITFMRADAINQNGKFWPSWEMLIDTLLHDQCWSMHFWLCINKAIAVQNLNTTREFCKKSNILMPFAN